MRRLVSVLVPVLLCTASALTAAAPAGANSATSWGFACSSDYGWVRANWPTIRTNTATLTPVYFRARLYQYTRSGWRKIGTSRWFVGVSNNSGRYQLDSSFGMLPYPFVGSYGHYFAYETGHGSYAGPQLGPYWKNLPSASYKTREQYWVRGDTWSNTHTRVQGRSSRWCNT